MLHSIFFDNTIATLVARVMCWRFEWPVFCHQEFLNRLPLKVLQVYKNRRNPSNSVLEPNTFDRNNGICIIS